MIVHQYFSVKLTDMYVEKSEDTPILVAEW